MNYSIDIGNNLTSLGFAFLALKYLLPLIIGIVLLVIFIYLIKWLFNYLGLQLNTPNQILLGLVGAGMIALLFLR